MTARKQKLIRTGELAKMAGVAPNTITGLKKKRLVRALVGKRIDLNHPDVQQYLNERNAKAPPETRPPEETNLEDPLPQEVTEVMDWTLEQILQKYGTLTQFKEILSAANSIEKLETQRLKNQQTKGSLVSRDLVKNYVLDAFQAAFSQLLTDGAKRMAVEARVLVVTEENDAAIERELSRVMSQYLKTAIDKACSELDNIHSSDEEQD